MVCYLAVKGRSWRATIMAQCEPKSLDQLHQQGRKLSGPRVDSATLQLIGVLFSSILLPGLASLLMAQ
eukprot:6468264-Amphidinium_carterae.1